MKPLELKPNVYQVGVTDWNMRDLHGYSTERGSTYNAFLIVDEKTTLIDTVRAGFVDHMLEAISHVADPRKIDYVVSNHTEMDHSGGLPRLLHRIGEDKPLFCSKMGHTNLRLHFPQEWNYHPVKDGEELNIGTRTLKFIETRMLHWPDSMFTYSPHDRILFSSDAFGQHYAGPERFDDEIGDGIMPHAKKYFANILLLYAPLVTSLLERVQKEGIAPDMICPDHGIVWRRDPGRIIDAYAGWSLQQPARKAVVVYDTMWHSTQTMAETIVEELIREGVDAVPHHLRSNHRSDVMTDVLDAGAVLVGSPTLNNGLFPTVSDFLTYMRGLKPMNKVAAAFGSYGWSGEAVKMISSSLEDMKLDVIAPGVRSRYVPDNEILDTCRDLGRTVASLLPQ